MIKWFYKSRNDYLIDVEGLLGEYSGKQNYSSERKPIPKTDF